MNYTLYLLLGVMECVHFDTMGPITPSQGREGNKYVFLAVCSLSGWVAVLPSPTKAAAPASKLLKDWISRYGAPKLVATAIIGYNL